MSEIRRAVRCSRRVMPFANLCAQIAVLATRIIVKSSFSHAANRRPPGATDGWSSDAGPAWEVWQGKGRGPDSDDRIAAFGRR